MEFVAHDGRETAYRETRPDGDGPTTLYVHGSGASHRVWAGQYAPDGPAHPAVALDLSGHGESDDVDAEPGPATLDAYADDVLAVARKTGPAVLVGNSLGGAVVQRILLDRNCDLEAAVLTGSGAKLAVSEGLRTWLADDFERAIEFLHGEDRLFHDPDAQTLERSRREMRDAGRVVTERDFLSCHTFDVRDRLGQVEVPVLALVGEYDGLTPPDYHEYLADHVPSAELAVVEDAAHLAMIEQPAAFNQAVATFLADRR